MKAYELRHKMNIDWYALLDRGIGPDDAFKIVAKKYKLTPKSCAIRVRYSQMENRRGI